MTDQNPAIGQDFIEVIDDALPLELCNQIIEAFDKSPNKTPGKTGGGVDPERKKVLTFRLASKPNLHHYFSKCCKSPVKTCSSISTSITLL